MCACDEPFEGQKLWLCVRAGRTKQAGLPCEVFCLRMLREEEICGCVVVRIVREIKESEAESASWFAKLANYCAKI